MIGAIRNITLMWSGLRPNPAAWERMSSRYAFMPATLPADAMMVSAPARGEGTAARRATGLADHRMALR